MFLYVSVILLRGGGGIPACIGGGIPACFAAGLQGVGVVSQYALQVSRPTPRGEVEGSGRGGAHPGGCIPSCTEADPPPMATAASDTHPTGMHSC